MSKSVVIFLSVNYIRLACISLVILCSPLGE